jgi:hypothetical protein
MIQTQLLGAWSTRLTSNCWTWAEFLIEEPYYRMARMRSPCTEESDARIRYSQIVYPTVFLNILHQVTRIVRINFCVVIKSINHITSTLHRLNDHPGLTGRGKMQWNLNSLNVVVVVVVVVVVWYWVNRIHAEGLGTWPKNGPLQLLAMIWEAM